MYFSLRSERFPGVAVGFRLPSGGRWSTDTSVECVNLDTTISKTRLTWIAIMSYASVVGTYSIINFNTLKVTSPAFRCKEQ